jgi:hypothetical protein
MIRIFRRHVLADLAAYDDGQLDPPRAARVKGHLLRCLACREALEEVRHGRRLLESLPAVTMPDDEVARLHARLRAPAVAAWRLRPLAAVLSIAALAAAAWWVSFVGIRPEIVRAAGPVGLERAAVDLHAQLRAGSVELGLVTDDPARIRAWQRAQGAPVSELASHASRDGWPAITMQGASVVTVDGARVSLVSFDVDGHRASLLTARQADVASAPSSAWLSKRVHYRDAGGHPALTWSTSGQTYTIVSDLPDAGERACLACHTSPRFKAALEREVRQVFGRR